MFELSLMPNTGVCMGIFNSQVNSRVPITPWVLLMVGLVQVCLYYAI